MALVRCSARYMCDHARRNCNPPRRIRTKCDEQHIVQSDAETFSSQRLAAVGGAEPDGECHEKPVVERLRRNGGNILQANDGRLRLSCSKPLAVCFRQALPRE